MSFLSPYLNNSCYSSTSTILSLVHPFIFWHLLPTGKHPLKEGNDTFVPTLVTFTLWKEQKNKQFSRQNEFFFNTSGYLNLAFCDISFQIAPSFSLRSSADACMGMFVWYSCKFRKSSWQHSIYCLFFVFFSFCCFIYFLFFFFSCFFIYLFLQLFFSSCLSFFFSFPLFFLLSTSFSVLRGTSRIPTLFL